MLEYTFIKELNDEQRKAATTLNGPVLILAGAGSGKTKTIVARTALIIAKKLAKPRDILVMTFTRKAAKEMKERGNKILAENNLFIDESPTFTTFHAWGINFLKKMPEDVLNNLNLSNNFSLINDATQEVLLKRLIPEYFDLSDASLAKSLKASKLLLPISNIQNRLIPYENTDETFEYLQELNSEEETFFSDFYPGMVDDDVLMNMARLYVGYKRALRESNSIDFDDLIALPLKVLQIFPNIKQWVKNSYKYLMVDEFQDTNGSQLALISEMLNDENNICVVGDDAQSIYGWRGSQIEFILNFDKQYSNVTKVNLKTNYRSVSSVVEKANSLLSHLSQKHEFKEDLVAFNQERGAVEAIKFSTADDEATYIGDKIALMINKGIEPRDIAVIYRNNAIARKFEEALIKNRIPYHVIKGKAFLDRKIVKQMINYFSLLLNPDNSLLFGSLLCDTGIITEERLGKFYVQAKELNIDLFQYFKTNQHKKVKGLRKAIIEGIDNALKEVESFSKTLSEIKEGDKEAYEEFINDFFQNNLFYVINDEVIKKNMNNEKVSEEALTLALGNKKNLETLNSLLLKYDSISTFLDSVLIEPDEDEEKNQNKVHLITAHSSKGLEFDYVFCVGMIEGVFPSSRSTMFANLLEEERRVAYVAFTRAKKILIATGAIKGGYYGRLSDSDCGISRFILEANISVADKTNKNTHYAKYATNSYNNNNDFKRY